MAVEDGYQAASCSFRRRLARLCLVGLVVVAGLAAVPVAAAVDLPACLEAVTMPTDPPAEIRRLIEVQNAVVAECEVSSVGFEVSQSTAHDDAWLILGLLAATVVSAAFFRVVLR